MRITTAGTVRVLENGSERYSWPIVVIDDRNPSIQLVREPSAGPRGALALAYRVEDDYGVVGAEAGFTLLDPVEDKPLELADGTRIGPLVEAPVMMLKLPRGDKAKAGEGRTTTDLTAHPWAGMRVRMVLRARDQAGQTGESTPSDMVLPGRPFRQPLARALVEQRRKLALTPGLVDEVRLALDALTIAPERFMADAQVYLGIRSVFWRLQYQRDKAGLESAVDQLWQIALRVEDGDLSDAERRLREAQDRLQQALKDGASEEELSQLMAELRDALNEFLKALTAEAQKNPDQNAETPQGSSRMTQQDLEQMLKSIEELAKSGATEDAQQMLSELRDMLERLQAGKQGEGGQAQQQMMETLEKFGGMITRQRKLLDDTFDERRGSGRPGSEGQRGRQTPGQGTAEDPQAGGREQGLGELGQRQGDLRQELDDLMRSMQGLGEEARRRFDDANGAMGQAERSLKEGDLDQATEAQSKALDELRKGAQSMTEQMIGSRQGQSGSQRAGGDDRDPLGRPSGEDALIDSQGRALPSEVDGQRARAILEELRRRLGESTRPATDLDYLERLLKKN
ncbi:MAG: TIGR02302 family protein [Hyphomicrobiaceae bacterium]